MHLYMRMCAPTCFHACANSCIACESLNGEQFSLPTTPDFVPGRTWGKFVWQVFAKMLRLGYLWVWVTACFEVVLLLKVALKLNYGSL